MLNIAERDKCFIIAEAGTCVAGPKTYLGRMADTISLRARAAKDYISAASEAGADAIKFQMFNIPIKDDMFCWIDGDEARQERWEKSYLPMPEWRDIKWYAEERNIMFLASVFQHSTVEWLTELGVEATKVASRAAMNFPYEREAPEPYLISDGMYPRESVWSNNTKMRGCRQHWLTCEAKYPSTAVWHGPALESGLSDHSGTPWRAIDAIARECKLIEVHFYINVEDAGPDLPASLSLDELKLVCEARDNFAELRNV